VRFQVGVERLVPTPKFVQRARLVGLILAGFAVAGLSFSSCSTLERAIVAPPTVEGASFVGNPACFDCHTNYVRVFAASPHARIHLEGAPRAGPGGCESCHGPGSKHIAAGGGRGVFIVNPGKDPAACFACHLETRAEFNLPQHHPVLEGKMNCVQCHDPHGLDIMKPAGGLAMARLNESCALCHREQARPHVFEHEALRDGCTVCHQPHGAINAKLLVDRDNNLCLRCHAQTPGPAVNPGEIYIGHENHTDKLRMGGCTSAGCHTAIHGSDIDRRLFY
jgi:predicted CXXCH cytochrome family protein